RASRAARGGADRDRRDRRCVFAPPGASTLLGCLDLRGDTHGGSDRADGLPFGEHLLPDRAVGGGGGVLPDDSAACDLGGPRGRWGPLARRELAHGVPQLSELAMEV